MSINGHKEVGNVKIIIAAVAAVVLLAVIGFVVWGGMQKKSDPSSGKENGGTASETLKIAEWGVEFEINKALVSTKVEYTAQKTAEPVQTYYTFTTSRIRTLSKKECAVRPLGDTIAVYRQVEKPTETADIKMINSEPIAGFYYTFISSPAACDIFSAEGKVTQESTTEMEDREALIATVKTLRPVK